MQISAKNEEDDKKPQNPLNRLGGKTDFDGSISLDDQAAPLLSHLHYSGGIYSARELQDSKYK